MDFLKHPNLLGLRYVVDTPNAIFTVTPLCVGKDLSQMYLKMRQEYRNGNKESYLQERQILRWAENMIQGLGAFHGQGLIHKDIRMTNILIDGAMKLVICDFTSAERVTKG